jgi:hypothetical protein
MKKSAQDQIDALRDTTEKELRLVRGQIDASKAQNDAVRDSARA